MTSRADLEASLRSHAEALDAEVGARPGLEERILSRAVATPPAAAKRMPLFREAAIATCVLVLAAAAGVGVLRLRAAHQIAVVKTSAPVTTGSASASPAPTLPSKLSYTPGVRVPPGPIELGSVYTDMPLRMLTPLRGWAIGPFGKGNTGDRDALLLTVDGGNHWRNVTPPGSSGWTDRTNFFLDLGHAWVAVTPHVVQQGSQPATITVYRTSDGAKSWKSSTFEVAGGSPGQLQFVDPLHGWLMLQIDQGQALYRTSDGGVDWTLATVSHLTTVGQPVPAGTLPMVGSYRSDFREQSCQFDPFGGVGFLDASTGFAAGSCSGPSLMTYFYVTHDGGNSWEPEALPALPGASTCPCRVITTHPDFTSPRNGSFTVNLVTLTTSCKSENGGTACAGYETPRQALVYVTADGGKSWTEHPLPGVAAYYGPDFVDSRNGWFSAVALKAGSLHGETEFDNLYVTHDAGGTWTPLSTGGSFPGGRLNFISTREGWAFPSYSDLPFTILHTSDGGRSWARLFPYVDG